MAIELNQNDLNRMRKCYDFALSSTKPDDAWRKESVGKLDGHNVTNLEDDEQCSKALYDELQGLIASIRDNSEGVSAEKREILDSILDNLGGLSTGSGTRKDLLSRTIMLNTLGLVHDVITSTDANAYATNEENRVTNVPKGFENIVESITENPGGGECLMYSVLDQLGAGDNLIEDKTGVRHLQADELRKKLLKHIAQKREVLLNNVGEGVSYVPFPKSDFQVSVEELKRSESYREGCPQLPLDFVPFLADMTKRPIVVVLNIAGAKADGGEKDSRCRVFDTDIDGHKLPGEPMAIFYSGMADSDTHGVGGGHFRAATLTGKTLDALGFPAKEKA